jgi:hypothetical protein
MSKGHYDGTPRTLNEIEESRRKTLKEHMMSRDVELARAMRTLEDVVHNLASSVAKVAASFDPKARRASRRQDFPSQFGHVGDIDRVTHQLKALMAELDRLAARHKRISARANKPG